MGRFAAYGDSFELHMAFVRAVVTRYRSFVELCERKAITWSTLGDGGGVVSGGPLVIKFSRPIENPVRFVDELLAVRRPFRLWGIVEFVGDVAQIEAVDLHVGQRLRLDVGQDWLRVYLERGSCGNTVARLVSNLQHHFDGALRLLDTELDAAVTAAPTRVAAIAG